MSKRFSKLNINYTKQRYQHFKTTKSSEDEIKYLICPICDNWIDLVEYDDHKLSHSLTFGHEHFNPPANAHSVELNQVNA